MHICVGNLPISSSDGSLSSSRRLSITSANAGILLAGPLRSNLNEILIEFHTFAFQKMNLKKSPAKWRPLCLGLIVFSTYLHSV